MKTKTTIAIFASVAAIVFGYFVSVAGAYSNFIVPDYDTISIYQFDNNLTDEAGSVNATVNLGSELYATGKFENAFDFNGSTNLNAHAGGAYTTSTFTIGMWVKYTTTDKFFYSSDDGYDSTRILDDAGKIGFQQCNGAIGCVIIETASSSMNDGQWHLIIATQQGAQGRNLYVDGTWRASDNNGIYYANTGSAKLGSNWDDTAKLTGQMDNVFIVRHAMSLAEVETIWNAGVSERVTLGAAASPIANDTISFNNPSFGQGVTNDDPNTFNVSWHTGAPSSSVTWMNIEIRYGTSTGSFASTTFTASTTRSWSNSLWNSPNGNTFNTFMIPKPTQLIPNQRYWAEATLVWVSAPGPTYALVSTTTATTTVLFYGMATSTPTVPACDGVWDCILYGFANTLFTPHDISMNVFRATYNQIQTSPPFSYLFGYITTAQTAATSTISTSTDYDVVLHMPAPWNNITLLTSSSYDNFVGTSTAFTKEKFFDVQRMVIWIGTGLKIISMFII